MTVALCLSLNSFPPKPSKPTRTLQSTRNKPHVAISLLQISQTYQELSQVHCLLIKTGLVENKNAFGRLLSSMAALIDDLKALNHALDLFCSPECPANSFVYNSMIKSYNRRGDHEAAFGLFAFMLYESSVCPDGFTYTFVCNACAKGMLLFEGRQIHARIVKDSRMISTPCWNALIDFYVKVGSDMWKVRQIVDEMKDVDIVSWNCLLDGYVKVGDLDNARLLFDGMAERDIVSWTTMLVGYASAGLVKEASQLFDEMPERNMVSWSAMIRGHVIAGQHTKALVLFKEMQDLEIQIDKITLTLLLAACAGSGSLNQGRWLHNYIQCCNIKVDAQLSTALVDMYAKCGKIDLAYKAFQEFLNEETFLWNAMLGGLAVHSCGYEALQLFSEMLRRGIKPNEITFINVLSACSHSGLVQDGLELFSCMNNDHGIMPASEHYGCLIDLLSRGGFLDEAIEVIETMPIEADGNMLRSLLSACRSYGNVALGEHVGGMLLDLEPSDDSNYVLVSNIYANESRWSDVARLRRAMKERGVRKLPGCSLIEVDGIVHSFLSKDKSHQRCLEIYALLSSLASQYYVHVDDMFVW